MSSEQARGRAEEAPVRRAQRQPKQERRGALHWMAALQRTAGNAAVTSLLNTVQRDSPAAPASASAVAGTVTIPGGITDADAPVTVSDYQSLRLALVVTAERLQERGAAFDDATAARMQGLSQQVWDEYNKIGDKSGPVSAADAAFLAGFFNLAAWSQQEVLNEAIAPLIAAVDSAKPSPEDQQRLENLREDIDEKMHESFIGRDEDKLAELAGLAGKLKSWTTKTSEWSGRAADYGPADLASRAKQIKALSKDLGDKLGTAREVLEIADDLATLAGAQRHPDGTAMMQGIDDFKSGIDLVDKAIGKLGKAVPLFGDLWSKWYKPLVDGCVAGLTKLAGLVEKSDREMTVAEWMIAQSTGRLERDSNGAPVIPAEFIAKGDFPGGQAVFSYLYCLREGRQPPEMSADVKVFFLDRTDIMNQVTADSGSDSDGGSGDKLTSEWHLFSPSTWGTANHETNLARWLPAHSETVWAMLYGGYGRYVPH
jgi:hypothetical protein